MHLWMFTCFTVALWSGCASQPVETAPVVLKRSQMLMGTLVFVTAVAGHEPTAQQAAQSALKEIRRLEELLSTWIPTSEFSHLNDAAGQPSPISLDTMYVLKRSLEVARLTEGGFNVAVGPAVQVWNVTEQTTIPTKEELELVRRKSICRRSSSIIPWAQPFLRVPACRWMWAGSRKDLRPIGRRRQCERQERPPVPSRYPAILKRSDGCRMVKLSLCIEITMRRQLLGTIELRDEAISTAGDYERYFERDGVRYHHTPRSTLEPARDCQSVTVIAKDGVMADGRYRHFRNGGHAGWSSLSACRMWKG